VSHRIENHENLGNADALDKYWGLAIAVVIACASLFMSRSSLFASFHEGTIQAAMVIAPLAVTLIVFVLYMEATRAELRLAARLNFIEALRAPRTSEIIIIFSIALCFGCLIAFVTNLLVYSALLLGLQVVDLIGPFIVNRRFKEAEGSGRTPPKARAALHEYYLVRHQISLRAVRAVGCVIGLLLAIFSVKTHRQIYAELAWAVILVSLLATEYVLLRWRLARNRKLERDEGEGGLVKVFDQWKNAHETRPGNKRRPGRTSRRSTTKQPPGSIV
jgi:hypothetical protein